MKRNLTILLLVKNFGDIYPKHKQKYDSITALKNHTNVIFWHEDGSILEILSKIKQIPDFILHYDMAWNYSLAPRIRDLDKVDIPKGALLIDTHFNKNERLLYLTANQIDLIFSPTKNSFLETYPQLKQHFRWLPFSINPNIIKDWKLEKTTKFLLMGLMYDGDDKFSTLKGRYPFREAVLKRMTNTEGFKYIKHPGHKAKNPPVVGESFSQELNRSDIFFTCGSSYNYPVIKFFEALGSKTLLLAEPNRDILELGFKNNENFVACNKEDFFEKAMYYSEHREERERITDNGFHFIHENHTDSDRAKQLLTYIESFLT
ncbi:glycosyltransferase [Bacillus sp. A301a_S52]|nr:glycosyltransferase [Bacillus sp. A301a_S52]